MSAQNDLIATLDLSALNPVTQPNIMQAINQLQPLLNIGGIIFQSTTPDVANNPRFARYIWLDSTTNPPVPKYYNSGTLTWTAVSISALSITNNEVSGAAGIVISKLGITGTGAAARAVARINAAGTAMEYVAPASINTTNEIPVNNLVAAGGDSYLKSVGGSVVWVAQATERSLIQASITGLLPSQISAGAAGRIIGVSGGITAFLTPDTAIGSGNLSPSALAQAGAATNDLLRWTGTIWDKVTPSLRLTNPVETINNGLVVGAMGVATTFSQAHGLVTVPKLIRAVAVCNTVDGVYNPGDEVNVLGLRVNATNFPAASIYADATNVVVSLASAAGLDIANKAGAGYAAMTEANWSIKVYAWK